MAFQGKFTPEARAARSAQRAAEGRVRWSHDAQGLVLKSRSTGMIFIPYQRATGGAWYVVVNGSTEHYKRGGYNLVIDEFEIETAIEMTPVEEDNHASLTPELDAYLTLYVESRGIPAPTYDKGTKIIEEARELQEAVVRRDVMAVMDEVADVIIVALVAARQFGFPPEEALLKKINKDKGRGQ